MRSNVSNRPRSILAILYINTDELMNELVVFTDRLDSFNKFVTGTLGHAKHQTIELGRNSLNQMIRANKTTSSYILEY